MFLLQYLYYICISFKNRKLTNSRKVKFCWSTGTSQPTGWRFDNFIQFGYSINTCWEKKKIKSAFYNFTLIRKGFFVSNQWKRVPLVGPDLLFFISVFFFSNKFTTTLPNRYIEMIRDMYWKSTGRYEKMWFLSVNFPSGR